MNKLKDILRFIQLLVIVIITMTMIGSDALSQDFKSEKDLQKAAEAHFKSRNYIDAFPLFSQLLSLYPSDANFNYKFSVCMLYSEEDKAKSIDISKGNVGKSFNTSPIKQTIKYTSDTLQAKVLSDLKE